MKLSAKITLLLIIAGALALGYYFYTDLSSVYRRINIGLEKGLDQLRAIDPKIITSNPLRGPTAALPSNLTVAGTISETNIMRSQNGLPTLSVNVHLMEAAQIKVDDMFELQYFEHDSPTGEGPGDLADKAGYDYIIVGENLAMGNYKDDQALVTAWMNSPGHRANILENKFTEIGVALKRGSFEGREVWLAVQEFGRPASVCTGPNESLEKQIEENYALLEVLEAQLSGKEQEINNTRPRRGSEYSQKVDEYNELVHQYNEIVEATKSLTSDYNIQVGNYNNCITS